MCSFFRGDFERGQKKEVFKEEGEKMNEEVEERKDEVEEEKEKKKLDEEEKRKRVQERRRLECLHALRKEREGVVFHIK